MGLEPRAIPFPGRSTNPPFFNKGLCIRVLIIGGIGTLALAHLLNHGTLGVEVQGVDAGYYTTADSWSQKAYALRSFEHEAATREGIDILRVKAAYGFGLIGSWPRRHYMPGATRNHTHRAGVRCRRLLFPIYRPYEHTRNFFLSASHHAGLMLPMAPSHLGGSVSAGGQRSVYL